MRGINGKLNDATVENIYECCRSMANVCDDILALICDGKVGTAGKHGDALDVQVAFLSNQNKRRGMLLDILKARGGEMPK